MHGGPLHHQADHPALVVERVVHPLLLAALRGLGVVGARRVKDGCNQRGQIYSTFSIYPKYTAERILGHQDWTQLTVWDEDGVSEQKVV